MSFLQRTFTIVAAVVSVAVVSNGAAIARGYGGAARMGIQDSAGYNGNWPVTVTRSQHSNGTFCLTLTESSKDGGSASVLIDNQKYPGSFIVINHTLVATLTAQGYSQNDGLVFIGSADGGNIGKGAFENVYGGSDFDSGALAFGMKGGC
jgi:hypothetical protein